MSEKVHPDEGAVWGNRRLPQREIWGRHGGLTLKDSYYNMKERILPVMHIIDRAKTAMEQVGITPVTVLSGGGTDRPGCPMKGCLVQTCAPVARTLPWPV